MAEDIAMVIVIVAALYGVADLMGRLAYRILFAKGGRQYVVVPLTRGREDAEYAVRRLGATRHFFPHGTVYPLLVDWDLGEEEQQLTQRLCDELRLEVCRREELGEILLTGLQEEQNRL